MPHKFLTGLVWVLLIVVATSGASKAPHPGVPGIKFKVLHHFTGGSDGCCILGGLARDRQGNLYGVAYSNDYLHGDGLLFKLTSNRGYSFRVLQKFSKAATGRECTTTPTPDNHGNLFGVCSAGGSDDKGTLWKYSSSRGLELLHSFTGPADGMSPEESVAVDELGNIYGTAYTWGPGGFGTLWEYSPASGAFVLLHSFADGDDGGLLPAGPRIDRKTGIIWGTTEFGPNCYYCGHGTVWNYDPSSGAFTTVLDLDPTEIEQPSTRLIIDGDGDVFGTAAGLVFKLQTNDDYSPTVLYEFNGKNDGVSPLGRVRFDKHRNLFGTTVFGGEFGFGTAYELTPSNDTWQEIILHSFNYSDGYQPAAGLKTDFEGHWFGTAAYGGNYDSGTVFEISGVR